MKKKILSIPIIVIIILLMTVGIGTAALFIGGGGRTGEVNLQKGLVGQWKMDGNAKDATPYGNNGTVTGAVLATDRKGQSNKAYSFDGSDDEVSIPDATAITDVFDAGGTAVAWIYPRSDGESDNGLIFEKTDSASEGWFLATVSESAGNVKIRFFQAFSGIDGIWDTTSAVVPINQWSHVAVTYDDDVGGNNPAIYINGVSTAVTETSTPGSDTETTDSSNPLFFGGRSDTDRNFDGSIDDVRIYNRALTQAEITALYESYDPGIVVSNLQKGLMGQWKMDGNAKDATPYGNNGTVTGAVLATDRKGQANKAYSFDGTDDYVSVGDTTTFKWLHGASDTTGFQFTISFWVAINDLTEVQHDLIFTENGGVAGTGIGVWYNNEAVNYGLRTIYARILRGGVDALVRTQAPDYSYPNDNGWHFITWTYDQALAENNSKLYIDGVFAVQASKTVQTPSTGNSSSALQFGKLLNYTATILNGKMDEVGIYNRALTQAEITALYESYDPGIVVSDLQKGLVGQWKMDGNAKDATPYGNNGTVTGAVLATDRKGQANKAYSFNGTSDYVDMGNTIEGLGAYSVSAWIKLDTLPGANSHYRISAKNVVSGFSVFNSTFPRLHFNNGNGSSWSTVFNLGTTQLSTGIWYFVTATLDGAIMKVYVNGGLDDTKTSDYSGIGSAANNRTIGSVGGTSQFFDGLIDDVRIYNRALSQTEITALYESY